jgi:hypothetical protein
VLKWVPLEWVLLAQAAVEAPLGTTPMAKATATVGVTTQTGGVAVIALEGIKTEGGAEGATGTEIATEGGAAEETAATAAIGHVTRQIDLAAALLMEGSMMVAQTRTRTGARSSRPWRIETLACARRQRC